MPSKLGLACALLAVQTASAQPGAVPVESEELRPPSSVEAEAPVEAPPPPPPATKRAPHATTRRWGGGLRLTGLSGIGALPGVNFGGELAANVRREELFVELAMGKWKPEKEHIVALSPEPVQLALDVWTVRAGWSSMRMPLRGWVLYEVGELASARSTPGVVTRMMMGETPNERQWHAFGAGFGVAWPMNDYARLVGMVELAVPFNRGQVMDETGGSYEPDPLAARSSAGIEIGWR